MGEDAERVLGKFQIKINRKNQCGFGQVKNFEILRVTLTSKGKKEEKIETGMTRCLEDIKTKIILNIYAIHIRKEVVS